MLIAWSPAPAEAREAGQRIDVSAGTLTEALAELAREAGVSIGTGEALPTRRTRPVKGTMTVDAALARLLAGSGLIARKVGPTVWRIERVQAARAERAPVRAIAAPPAAPPGEPIVVTGSKRPTPLLDLPIAIAAVDLGEKSSVNSGPTAGTGTIAAEIEGLTVTALGSGRNRMFLRGVADSPFNGESQSTVAVVLDDARLTYSAPDPDIALVDMERVEVLKEPQGSLYGTGALGGIYHLVSRRASLDENSLELTSGGEIVARGGVGYSAGAVANVAVAPGVLGLRLVGYQRERPGWIDTGGRADSNSDRLTGVRGELGFEPGEGWRLDATGFAQWRDADDSQYVYAPGARSRPAQLPEPHDNDVRHVAMRIAREGGAVDAVLSSGATWHEVGDTYDATIGAGSFGVADPQTLEADRKYRVWDNELRFSGSMGVVQWLAGASAVAARQRGEWLLSGSRGEQTVDYNRRDATDLALFGDVTVPLTGTLSLDAGARLFHSEVSVERSAAEDVETRELARTGVTPSFALSWRPDADRLAFVRYGSAIREGGLGASSSGEPTPLEGDELATLEAGWRQQLAGGGRLDLGAYYTRWDHVQSDVLLPNGLLALQNVGTAGIQGVEGSLELPLGMAWDVSLGGTLQHARLTRNELEIELDDRRLPAIPDVVLRAAVQRRFSLGGAEASLRLKLRYVGSSRLSFDPQLDRPMGDYVESGLEGQIDLGQVELALTLDNLLGQHGDAFPFGNPLRFALADQYTPQEPVNASLAVRTRF